MQKSVLRIASASLMVIFMALSLGPTPGNSRAFAQNNCQTFPETGKTVCGKFLTYWNAHGGLRQQGYPISNEMQEKSDTDGKSYTVQYFERAVFELHPENQPPYDVLLTLLGTMRLKEKYPNGPPAPPTAVNPQCGQYFPETDKYLCGDFLEYWKANGGLTQQGYPLTGTFSERSEIDGNLYTVQYFERAVMELHPENQPPNNVLLMQLGTMRYKQRYPNGQPGGPPLTSGTALQQGDWGGEHVMMTVRTDGAHLEFDCAHATLPTPPTVDSAGKLNMQGTYVQEHGGPILVGQDENGRPARFTGALNGQTLTLTITYADDGSTVGTYTLTHGKQSLIRKCL